MKSLGWVGSLMIGLASVSFFVQIDALWGFSWFTEIFEHPISAYGIFGISALLLAILIRIEHLLWELKALSQETERARYYYKGLHSLPAHDDYGEQECSCGDRFKQDERGDICGFHYPRFLRWFNGATEAHEIGSEVRYAIENAADVLAEKIAERLREDTK